jgi:hypothetical protein
MRSDVPFPLEAVPPRLRNAILKEFQGRCPSIEEVARVPDKQWLSTPDVGRKSMEIIHDITDRARPQTTHPVGARMTDAELLGRLEWLQNEIRWLRGVLKGRVSGPDPAHAVRKGRQRQVSL